jgi:AraC-like DNA-binding protein
MINVLDNILANPGYKKLEVDDFLFAEYTCGVTNKKVAGWTPTDYIVHVVTGRKTWHTPDGVWRARPGDTLFFKKGAAVFEQHFEQDVCLLMFFISDECVRGTVRELAGHLATTAPGVVSVKSAARVENNLALSAFFQSMRTYFAASEKPSEPLLRHKVKELILGVLTSGSNPALADYFRKIGESDAPLVREIMEANCRYNLSLAEYARLCHRSLSSFKREFQAAFAEPPGKWLLRKRLDYSATLLRNSRQSVTEIAFDTGFQDVSHFSRVFKHRFGVPPVAYRSNYLLAA